MDLKEAMQTAFNMAWNGLKAQGWRRSTVTWDGVSRCAYMGPDGMRCALGHCMETVDPSHEGAVSYELLANVASGSGGSRLAAPLLEYVQTADADSYTSFANFCDRMQCAHDFADSEHRVESRMRDVAARYDLTIPG